MGTKIIQGRIKSLAGVSIKATGTDPNTGALRIEGFASAPRIDRMGEVVDTEAFTDTMKNFITQNPVMLYMHNMRSPVGTWDGYEIRKDGLWVTGVVGHGFEPADTARAQIEQGILKALSIGFREIDGQVKKVKDTDGNEHEVYHITDLELMEISLVSIPACREALFTVSDGKLCDIEIVEEEEDPQNISDSVLEKMCVERGLLSTKQVIPYSKYPTQDKNAPWSGPKARAAFKKWAEKNDGSVDFSIYRRGFAFVPSGEADKTSSYKLPHHNIVEGAPVTNLRGSRAAMAALAGARGGVSIPEADQKRVYNHIAKHIGDDFGEDVPAFSDLGKLYTEDSDAVLTSFHTTAEDVDSILAAEPNTEASIKEQPPVQKEESTSEAAPQADTTIHEVVDEDGKPLGYAKLDEQGRFSFLSIQAVDADKYRQATDKRIEALEQHSKQIEVALVKNLKVQVGFVTRLDEMSKQLRLLGS